MKTIFLVFFFIPFFSFSQKDSTLFRDQFYVEINGGVGLLNYTDNLIGSPTNNPELLKYNSFFVNAQLKVNV